MKTGKLMVVFSILIAFLFSSCNIEKRVYMPGYHVEWYDFNSKQAVLEKPEPAFEYQSNKDQKLLATAVVDSEKGQAPVEATLALAEKQPVVLGNTIAEKLKYQAHKLPFAGRMEKFVREKANKKANGDDPEGKNMFPVIGLALSVFSILCFLIALAMELSPIAFVFVLLGFVGGLVGGLLSGVGLKKAIKEDGKPGEKIMSIVGIAFGFFGMILCILLFWYLIFNFLGEY